MKKILLTVLIAAFSLSAGFAQNSKAEKQAAAAAAFNKASAAIDTKAFAMIPDQYETSNGNTESNNDDYNFIAFDNNFFYMQGAIITGNSFCNRTTVKEFEKKIDKRGNLTLTMLVQGSAITAKIEIMMRKNGNYADVIVTPTKGDVKRFSGEIVPRSESNFRKRPNEV